MVDKIAKQPLIGGPNTSGERSTAPSNLGKASGISRRLSRKLNKKERERLGQGPGNAPDLGVMAPRVSSHALRLSSPSGQVSVPAENYFLRPDGTLRPEVSAIAKIVLHRAPEVQAGLNQALTEAHAGFEMSFRVKDPETGNYDKIFKVPSYGTVVPLSEAHFQQLVESTGPVLRALRKMLQAIYAQPDASPEALGIAALPKSAQERVLQAVKESLYFEPKLLHPAMKDYPFLTVGGFDAPVDLANKSNVFFEYNLGTPSGISNNVQLLESLRQIDPELYASFEQRLPKDDTFERLRAAVESNALAWTKNPRGISVVIGPGVENGAHPDVASIALFSGMPLVNPSDLYQDKKGDIRLNIGEGQHHPIVTGIYGRMEEAYFLSDVKAGIPVRGPEHEDYAALGQRLGVKLEPGVAYDFVYAMDDDNKVVAVRKDENGRPKLMQVQESIGRDPARPEQEPGSFLGAIQAKKLYYSGLGGRVVDDKRVFQAVAEHMAPLFTKKEGEAIARPPRTLELAEYDELYQSKNLERYVIKPPDKSGGDGVKLLCNMTPEAQAEALAEVKADPTAFIIQEFAQPAVMTSVEHDADGKAVYGTLANDWRIFAMLDANGEVSAGPHSLLLRAAKPFSASTNTSQGAGYGVGVVLSEQARARPVRGSLLPKAEQEFVSISRKQDLATFLARLHQLTVLLPTGKASKDTAAMLAKEQRPIMDLLGRELSPLMTLARQHAAGSINDQAFYLELLGFRALMLEHDYPASGVADMVRAALNQLVLPMPQQKKKAVDREVLRALAPIVPFKRPIRVREEDLGQGAVAKFEIGRYVGVKDASFAGALAEIEAAGGEIRRITLKTAAGEGVSQVAAPYFRLDEAGRPIIGIDVGQDYALAGLAHEMEHFRAWREKRDELLAAGVEPKAAAQQALDHWNEPLARVEGERRSLEAELKAETKPSPLNRGRFMPPRQVDDHGYIARILYPELEGIRELLLRQRWNKPNFDQDVANNLFDRLVTRAKGLRREAFTKQREKASRFERSPDASVRAHGHLLRALAHQERGKGLFDSVVSLATSARLQNDQTLDAFTDYFKAALIRAGLRGDGTLAFDPFGFTQQQLQQQQ